jgi:hypothetical protein
MSVSDFMVGQHFQVGFELSAEGQVGLEFITVVVVLAVDDGLELKSFMFEPFLLSLFYLLGDGFPGFDAFQKILEVEFSGFEFAYLSVEASEAEKLLPVLLQKLEPHLLSLEGLDFILEISPY